ncbi:carboxymuconolactone decarboxylase family protein [Stakelama sediminis]|uniref:AhpD family alkylhydroperoxidase n=1 Tax=Stakelama sediminis TaxID=463200 RepID=A0A840YX84_9SPHN|nr:carboxymuconolactone decarboxylase family protein [Stakelama sediminis]MBB5718175.1 AhpD family alkylhydroperoxidase [Stakelama sediminis]
MVKDYTEIVGNISEYVGELRKAEPDALSGFYAMVEGACADGALDKKTKELMAMAIAVALRCDGCIGFHAKSLVEQGVTREELTEALATCVYMGGGPSLMYAADALRAYDQFVRLKPVPV